MNQYEDCLSWCKSKGLFLDSRIERKSVNGLYGMYATSKIPEGTVIASFPVASILPFRSEFVYSDHEKVKTTKWVHAAAIELRNGRESEHYGMVSLFEPLEAFKESSSYYFSNEDLEIIKEMNPLCYNHIIDMKNLDNFHLNKIKKLDPDLSEDLIIQAILNSDSRIFGNFGFLPIIDLFNHSDKKGSPLTNFVDTESVGYKTICNYEAGEQVWASYGAKDLFINAVNFNYFDPDGEHFISYGLRAVQTISSAGSLAVAEYVATQFKSNFFEQDGQKKFEILALGLYFTKNRPTDELLNFFTKTSFSNQQEYNEKKCSKRSIATRMTYIIDSFLNINKVDDFNLKDLPKKLHRFYHLSKMEKEMLLRNREWVNSYFG